MKGFDNIIKLISKIIEYIIKIRTKIVKFISYLYAKHSYAIEIIEGDKILILESRNGMDVLSSVSRKDIIEKYYKLTSGELNRAIPKNKLKAAINDNGVEKDFYKVNLYFYKVLNEMRRDCDYQAEQIVNSMFTILSIIIALMSIK